MNGEYFTVGDDNEMTNENINRLIEYLKTIKKWTDTEIIKLLQYITKK